MFSSYYFRFLVHFLLLLHTINLLFFFYLEINQFPMRSSSEHYHYYRQDLLTIFLPPPHSLVSTLIKANFFLSSTNLLTFVLVICCVESIFLICFLNCIFCRNFSNKFFVQFLDWFIHLVVLLVFFRSFFKRGVSWFLYFSSVLVNQLFKACFYFFPSFHWVYYLTFCLFIILLF